MMIIWIPSPARPQPYLKRPKRERRPAGIEAAELQEIFLWKTKQESRDLSERDIERVSDEIADVFIFLTYLCHEFKIDLLEVTQQKIKKNGEKYPVQKSKGSNRKYNEL